MATRKVKFILMLVSILPLIAFEFLTNTLFGMLIVALGLFLAAPSIGITPSFGAIANAVSHLDPGTLLAAVGLFAAYFLTLITWRRQKIIELRLAAGTEVRDFFQEASDHALTLQLFADALAEAAESAKSGKLHVEVWRLSYLRNKLEQAVAQRDRLTAMGRSVHALANNVTMLVNSSFFAQRALPRATEALSDLSIRALFYIPDLSGDDVVVARRLKDMNVDALERYRGTFPKRNLDMITHAGSVFGVFIQPLITPNLAFFWSQLRMIRTMSSVHSNDLP